MTSKNCACRSRARIRGATAWPKLPAGIETTPGVTARERLAQAEDDARRGVRRIPAPRSDRAQPDARRAARDSARHDPDARGRQPAQGVLHRIRSAVRQHAVPGQGLSIARPGGDLRRARSGFKRGAAFRGADGTWQGDVVAPIIRDLGAALAMRPEPRDRAHGAERADGQGRAADGRPRPAHRRFRLGHSAGGGAAVDQQPDRGRHGPGVRARRARARRRVVHRRGRIVARRMARGDQSVRRAAAAGGLLPREQPDRAVDAGARTIGRARVRGQGRRLRHSRHHDRRHRSRRDRGGVHVGGRARARGRRPGADRARRDAHVRARASRRHAVSRQGSAAVVGLPAAHAAGLRGSEAVRVLARARSDSRPTREARSAGPAERRRARSS